MNTWLLADSHFTHRNIIDYENRPFPHTDEMDDYMIRKWNSVVKKHDLVLHLGDLFFGNAEKQEEIAKQLNGRKILIRGNHDKLTKSKYQKLGFDVKKHYFLDDYLLTHHPQYDKALEVAMEYGVLKGNVHGHVHSRTDHLNPLTHLCVSVELFDYTPVLWEEVKALFERNQKLVA